MRLLLTISLFLLSTASTADNAYLLLHRCPLAGSQYYALGEHWQQLRVGDRLSLVREAGNRHDPRAIRVEWHGQALGYVPRADNRLLAEAMDAGDRLSARIARLRQHPDPWQRVELEVLIAL